MDRATGPNPANLASICRSSAVAGRPDCSMSFSVRMAAIMSRALPFSPLEMAADGIGPEVSGRGDSATGASIGLGGASMGVTGGGTLDSVEYFGEGASSRESKRLGCLRDDPTRETNEFGRMPLPDPATVFRSRPDAWRSANDPRIPSGRSPGLRC